MRKLTQWISTIVYSLWQCYLTISCVNVSQQSNESYVSGYELKDTDNGQQITVNV